MALKVGTNSGKKEAGLQEYEQFTMTRWFSSTPPNSSFVSGPYSCTNLMRMPVLFSAATSMGLATSLES